MTLSVMKEAFKKFQPRILNYRSHTKIFPLRHLVLDRLSNKVFVNNDNRQQRFC